MSIRTITIATTLALISTACVARSVSPGGIVVNSDGTKISGWFSARGEWALFPKRNKTDYNPYTTNDNEKCVSLVNKTGLSRSRFEKVNNKYISLTGFAVAYDKLADGNSPSDKLLSKKYFELEPVENYCLRKYVFVVTRLLDN